MSLEYLSYVGAVSIRRLNLGEMSFGILQLSDASFRI